ncbi:MAG: hypothetical protein COA67_11195 [Lutibacter sp.]|nr:MAG: hypothetical protein COA67_11195 [Lutibacter sp.]
MKIKTITCHEVYNYGASLQEYALLIYLEELGHQAMTIHYKPDYLSQHFNLWRISSPKWNKNIILRFIYLTIKLPARIKILKRKRSFDKFSEKYIKRTQKLYRTNDDLKNDIPEADAYICGSDQIWNSFFQNGKDPAFYLNFAPDNKLKISYAASFAIDQIAEELKSFVKKSVERIDHISVRETSGVTILNDLGVENVLQVMDPVFLLKKEAWNEFELPMIDENFIFIYDFDSNILVKKMAMKMKEKYNAKIYTVNSNINYADRNFNLEGPETYLSLVKNAKFIVTNSFHAVAFSLIFEKQFVVFNRVEKINTRMRDLLQSISLRNLLLLSEESVTTFNYTIDYTQTNIQLNKLVEKSKHFLNQALEE